MCGAYGTTLFYKENHIKEELKHTAFRYPDKIGWQFYEQNNHQIIFRHNRLSIIDLEPMSVQPFTYYEHIHIVFNREVYNLKVIKKMLIQLGYKFNITSDSEVLCAAYLEYSQDCVKHFNGIFTFVIYDKKSSYFLELWTIPDKNYLKVPTKMPNRS